jgi:protein-L-isoaspartate(D-aspartate) O-methyltransferase
LQVGDGWQGWPEEAPFDAIHVGAAAHDFPTALMQQLKVGGVLIIPVGPQGGIQHLYKVERMKESVPWTRQDYIFSKLLGVRYVPLVQP